MSDEEEFEVTLKAGQIVRVRAPSGQTVKSYQPKVDKTYVRVTSTGVWVDPDPPPPPPTPTFYASPTGNDAANGSQATPWQSPARFLSQANPGDTLVCSGTWPAGSAGGWVVNRSGTAEKPITIRGGTFMGTTRFAFNFVGASHVVFEDMALLDWDQPDTGIITSTGGAHHLTFRRIKARLALGGDSRQHTLYMGPNVHDVLVEDPDFDGNGGSGCGISVFSSSGYPYGLTVKGGLIRNFSGTHTAHGRGVGIASSAASGPFLIDGTEFGNNKFHAQLTAGKDIAIRNCHGPKGINQSILRDVAQTPGFVESGNVWGDLPPPPVDPVYPPVPSNFTTIQAAVNASSVPFSVPPGVYSETVTITKAGQEVWFKPGAILDSNHSRPYALVLNGDGVKIRGELEIRRYAPPLQDGAVRVLKRADVKGVPGKPVLRIHDIKTGTGISSRDHTGSVIEDLLIHNCGQAGYHGTNIGDTTWRRWEIHNTNTERVDPGWEAGVGKVSRTRNLVQEDFNVHDVYGHGIWADIDNRGWVVRRARVQNVTHSGIFFEISEGATIEDCVIVNCGHGGGAWGYGAGIQLSSSKDIVARRNIVAWCNRGISVIAQNRGSYPVTTPGDYRNIRVDDNVVVDDNGQWIHQWVDDRAGQLFTAAGNGGARNRYWSGVAEPVGDRFGWSGPKQTLAQFAATPAEDTTVYLTLAEKDQILSAAGVPTTRP